ncbi:hypothetical protein MIR68_011567 [Amoeboaphelidium protococcarum]|nr:hypothetical protein MIR68_011567 [Amoeboaphelidium protococcarum]
MNGIDSHAQDIDHVLLINGGYNAGDGKENIIFSGYGSADVIQTGGDAAIAGSSQAVQSRPSTAQNKTSNRYTLFNPQSVQSARPKSPGTPQQLTRKYSKSVSHVTTSAEAAAARFTTSGGSSIHSMVMSDPEQRPVNTLLMPRQNSDIDTLLHRSQKKEQTSHSGDTVQNKSDDENLFNYAKSSSNSNLTRQKNVSSFSSLRRLSRSNGSQQQQQQQTHQSTRLRQSFHATDASVPHGGLMLHGSRGTLTTIDTNDSGQNADLITDMSIASEVTNDSVTNDIDHLIKIAKHSLFSSTEGGAAGRNGRVSQSQMELSSDAGSDRPLMVNTMSSRHHRNVDGGVGGVTIPMASPDIRPLTAAVTVNSHYNTDIESILQVGEGKMSVSSIQRVNMLKAADVFVAQNSPSSSSLQHNQQGQHQQHDSTKFGSKKFATFKSRQKRSMTVDSLYKNDELSRQEKDRLLGIIYVSKTDRDGNNKGAVAAPHQQVRDKSGLRI